MLGLTFCFLVVEGLVSRVGEGSAFRFFGRGLLGLKGVKEPAVFGFFDARALVFAWEESLSAFRLLGFGDGAAFSRAAPLLLAGAVVAFSGARPVALDFTVVFSVSLMLHLYFDECDHLKRRLRWEVVKDLPFAGSGFSSGEASDFSSAEPSGLSLILVEVSLSVVPT